jgi:hypothetical protein
MHFVKYFQHYAMFWVAVASVDPTLAVRERNNDEMFGKPYGNKFANARDSG